MYGLSDNRPLAIDFPKLIPAIPAGAYSPPVNAIRISISAVNVFVGSVFAIVDHAIHGQEPLVKLVSHD
jgi:hypothetical protein